MIEIPDYTYENMRRVCYEEGATFVPVCPTCGRFVKADNKIQFKGLPEGKEAPNATCKKCGRVKMLFEGFM